jgi:hypothetical protein
MKRLAGMPSIVIVPVALLVFGVFTAMFFGSNNASKVFESQFGVRPPDSVTKLRCQRR